MPRAAAQSAAPGHGLSRPGEASAAAQALAPKKPSGFLRLFRRIAEAAGRKASGETPSGREISSGRVLAKSGGNPSGREGSSALETLSAQARKKTGASEAGEFRAEAEAARAARKPRRGEARQAGRQIQPDAALSAEAVAAALPAPARRWPGAGAQEAALPAVGARREPRPTPPRVFVIDLRVRPAGDEHRPESRRAAATPERGEAPRSFERVLLAREAGSAGPGSSLSGSSPTSMSGSALPGSLRERLLPQIVHQAGIVLREGGEGEIRLVLKPEHLGSVRIRLHLGESSLEGRIVVDNSNVKELLDAHLEQLKSALRQEGYASANIDVTVSGGGGERRDLEPDPALPADSGRTAGQFERATPAVMDLGFTTVNLLA
jgi:flagellar hook-length control protein FliK